MLRENLNQSEIILEEGNNLSENQSSNSIQKQNQNSKTEQVVTKKSLCLDIVGLLCLSSLSAGVGYLLGGLIRTFVDLSKGGILELQKRSKEENEQRYIGVNDYTVAGLSLGGAVGVFTYLFALEYIKQRNEREAELRAVRDNIAENDNFNGALERQGVVINHQGQGEIANGVTNGDHQMRLVGAEITVNGDARNDLSRNPRHIMAVGEGNMNNRNVGSIFQSARSGGVPIESSDVREELHIANFEKLLDEVRENAKLQERELSKHEESQLEVANNFSKNSSNLVFVRRDQEYQKQIEETMKQEDDGAGVFSARRSQSPRPSIEQDLSMSAPNPETEIQSAYASALESLKSPRGNVRSSQAREMHCDIDELMRSQPVFRAVKAFKQNPPQDKSGAR
jgi:hypothetical protein